MGVIKKNKSPYFNNEDDINSIDLNNEENITFNNFINLTINSGSTSENNTILNLVASSEDEASLNENFVQLLELKRRLTKSNKKKTLTKPQPMFRSLGCKGKSMKKYRRYENASFLNPYFIKLVDNDDIFRELDIFDFVSENNSPFSLLLLDNNKMKVWNEFNDLTEEDQEYILDEIDKNEISKQKNKYQKNSSLQKIKNTSENNLTSQQCYSRIDNCLKSVLRKKNLSANMMKNIEQELIDYFKKDPHSVYEICLDSSFARLLLHACAQYHNLSCHSFDKEGNRWSYVKNKSNIFNSTIMSLSSYLESSSYKKNLS